MKIFHFLFLYSSFIVLNHFCVRGGNIQEFEKETNLDFSYFGEPYIFDLIFTSTMEENYLFLNFSLVTPRFNDQVSQTEVYDQYSVITSVWENTSCGSDQSKTDEKIQEICSDVYGICVDSGTNAEIFCYKSGSKIFKKAYSIGSVNSQFELKIIGHTPTYEVGPDKHKITLKSKDIFFEGESVGNEDKWEFDIEFSNFPEPLDSASYTGKVILCDKEVKEDGRECYSMKSDVLENAYTSEEIKEIKCDSSPKKIVKFDFDKFKSLVEGVNDRSEACLKHFFDNNFLSNLCDCEEEDESKVVTKFETFKSSITMEVSTPRCTEPGLWFNKEMFKCYSPSFNCTHDCNNQGSCVEDSEYPGDLSKGVCVCHEGYAGDDCLYPVCQGISAHEDISCSSHGNCVRPNECDCFDEKEYKGVACGEPVCDKNPCVKDHGYCSEPNVCQCNYGYTGDNCEEHVCRPNCLNDGLCVDVDRCNCTLGYYGPYCAEKIGKQFLLINRKLIRLPYQLDTVNLGNFLFQEKTFPCTYIIKNAAEIFNKYPFTNCYFSCDDKYEQSLKDDDDDDDTDSSGKKKKCSRTQYLNIEMLKPPSTLYDKHEAIIMPVTGTGVGKSKVIKIVFQLPMKDKIRTVVEKHFTKAVMVVIIVVAILIIIMPILLIMCVLICCLIYCQVCLICCRFVNILRGFYMNAEQFGSFKKLEDEAELEDELSVDDNPRSQLLETTRKRNQELGDIIEEVGNE